MCKNVIEIDWAGLEGPKSNTDVLTDIFQSFGKLVNHYFLLVFTSKTSEQKLVKAEIKTSKKTSKLLVFENVVKIKN